MATLTAIRGQEGVPAGVSWYYKKLNGLAEVTAIYTTPIVIAAEVAPAAGQLGKRLVPYYTAWKFTPGSTAFDFPTMSGSFGFPNSAPDGSLSPSRASLNSATEPYVTEKIGNDGTISTGNYTKKLELTGGTPPTQGDGVIEVWVAYKFEDFSEVGQ
tara:strand:- start:3790 stop:4260 length:471 start_codon:yes stop_codon:yes gene_type:complete